MRAVVQHSYGGPEVLAVEQVPRPRARPGEVVVRVRSAAVDRGVWHLMTGRPYLIRPVFGLRAPRNRVLGLDLAGTVSAVGERASGFEVGDEVFGIGKGSYAEYARAEVGKLAHKPAQMSFPQAAALPESGLTALQAVRDVAGVERGQDVLVIGASGGVGSYAVQLARAWGADVTGVCRTDKMDLVGSLGASKVIDYTEQDCLAGPERFDVILDIGGNNTLRRLRGALRRRGTLVIVGGENAGAMIGGIDRQARAMALSLLVPQRLTSFVAAERGQDLRALRQLWSDGKVAPALDRSYPLDEAARALWRMQRGEARGKVVINVAGD